MPSASLHSMLDTPTQVPLQLQMPWVQAVPTGLGSQFQVPSLQNSQSGLQSRQPRWVWSWSWCLVKRVEPLTLRIMSCSAGAW